MARNREFIEVESYFDINYSGRGEIPRQDWNKILALREKINGFQKVSDQAAYLDARRRNGGRETLIFDETYFGISRNAEIDPKYKMSKFKSKNVDPKYYNGRNLDLNETLKNDKLSDDSNDDKVDSETQSTDVSSILSANGFGKAAKAVKFTALHMKGLLIAAGIALVLWILLMFGLYFMGESNSVGSTPFEICSAGKAVDKEDSSSSSGSSSASGDKIIIDLGGGESRSIDKNLMWTIWASFRAHKVTEEATGGMMGSYAKEGGLGSLDAKENGDAGGFGYGLMQWTDTSGGGLSGYAFTQSLYKQYGIDPSNIYKAQVELAMKWSENKLNAFASQTGYNWDKYINSHDDVKKLAYAYLPAENGNLLHMPQESIPRQEYAAFIYALFKGHNEPPSGYVALADTGSIEEDQKSNVANDLCSNSPGNVDGNNGSSGNGSLKALEDQVGKLVDIDGFPAGNPYQCYDLSAYYARKLSGFTPIAPGGAAGLLGDAPIWEQNGWKVKKNPKVTDMKAGDVINWVPGGYYTVGSWTTDPQFGHTAVIAGVNGDKVTIYTQNPGPVKKDTITIVPGSISSIIRPPSDKLK